MGDNSFVGTVAAASGNLCGSAYIPELSSNTRDPYITSANGLPSLITGKGTISLTPTLSLSRALLVPNIHSNLLSVGRLLDTLKASATFYPTHCSFQDLKTCETIGHVRDRIVYTVQSCNVKDKQQLWLWHRRLGHSSFGYLKCLFSSLFRSCAESSFKCEPCILTKGHRTVFPLSDSKAAKPFDLVHSDVWGPTRVTFNGFCWFVTFIDDCTRLTWVYLMKNKHDVASILPEFCAMLSTQFHDRVKVFRLIKENGVSERKNRHLLEVARSLLLDMSVPHHLWGHGVLTATYLINCTPSRVLDFKTPLDILCAHTSPVSVSKLPPKVFGCVAYVHVYSHQRSKLDPCALRCVFIGYSTTQKGYKCYHPHTQNVNITLDVTFHEEGEDDTKYDLGEKMIGLLVDSDRLHRSGAEEESTLPRNYQSPRCARPLETTGRPDGCDRPPGSIDAIPCVSCEDEFDTIPPSALPLPQSNRDTESSELISPDMSVSTYQLPP
ncbi:hypothetical protein L3X38_017397 [Prunus dulcis]|uniref:Integrase catalytic domain-containing protein n=1 Tax=Prunus dulcis TaxID=3755 RepID=A0AAD4W7R5_PRUDU|nr:hypothetical protein L3X38_017397 [Prunus dulcis]